MKLLRVGAASANMGSATKSIIEQEEAEAAESGGGVQARYYECRTDIEGM